MMRCTLCISSNWIPRFLLRPMAYSVSLLLLLSITLTSCHANKLGLDFHHRFSDKVQEWTKSRGLPPTWNPEEAPRGSVEYYQRLLKYDLHRHHGRSLAEGDLYAFANGSETYEYLGNLHYAFVDLGTPNQTFLVALDTGSHLFWVPCNCKQCAPTSDPQYGKFVFSNYEPNASTTSKMISCSSDQCFTSSRLHCTNQSADCTYLIQYGDNSSSSGTLVQDDLYLIKEDTTSKTVKLPIVFGCGEVQTGNLLDGAAPNGLMGLGISNISVPSMITNGELTSDSFSMCFGLDGYGQLNFGDEGSADQHETKLNINANPFYNISLTEIGVGSEVSKLSFTAIVDSGTTFSGFTDDIYTLLGTMFSAQVTDKPTQIEGVPFDYCFEISADETKLSVPRVYFTTKGGSPFEALKPIIVFIDQKSKKLVAYCLGITRYDINIIGENFLRGQRIVFDREKQVLGWKPYNCSDSANTSRIATSPTPSHISDSPPHISDSPPAMPKHDMTSSGLSIITRLATSLIPITLMWLLIY